MQSVEATRFFISQQFGNVDIGRILEVSDHQAEAFVSHGLAKLIKPVVPPKNKKAPSREGQSPLDFTPPGGGRPGLGSSSQAAVVSQKKTAKKSGRGGKKVKRKRAKRKPKTS